MNLEQELIAEYVKNNCLVCVSFDEPEKCTLHKVEDEEMLEWLTSAFARLREEWEKETKSLLLDQFNANLEVFQKIRSSVLDEAKEAIKNSLDIETVLESLESLKNKK